ncbi:hypothetical protein V5799_014037 [Amblyomma americanum]|uniref:DDE-1 domain-containing protein n=1 Tax=Amblyomma americanum TaxID=6943 RepID=A0AAQ4E472_AMBAM
MPGSHKLLLIIGKVEKPCCFKNARLRPKDDVLYRSNKKAWMTAALFEEYVRHLDLYAWKQVEGEMIRRCFTHAGFSKQQDGSSEDASDGSCTLDDEGESLCARMTDFDEENGGGGNGLTFADYLSAEPDVQTSYANLEGEICSNGPSNEGKGGVKPARAPALAAVIESLNVVRSFVECSGVNSELLRTVSRLEDAAYGTANYRAKQSRIDDYFK